MTSDPSSPADLAAEAIETMLSRHPVLVRLVVSQRAKFEGWLKCELAQDLEQMGLGPVQLEPPCGGTAVRPGRADLSFMTGGRRMLLELKTCNTNFRLPGAVSVTRPITKNIQDICDDCVKLRRAGGGVMAFVAFPLDPTDLAAFQPYLSRVLAAAGRPVARADRLHQCSSRLSLLVTCLEVGPLADSSEYQGDVHHATP